jgi:hypothetical protein
LVLHHQLVVAGRIVGVRRQTVRDRDLIEKYSQAMFDKIPDQFSWTSPIMFVLAGCGDFSAGFSICMRKAIYFVQC